MSPGREHRDPPTRPLVYYARVNERLFLKSCRHCHSDPHEVNGNAGPGDPDLDTYKAARSGSLDDAGQRRSVLAAQSDGAIGRTAQSIDPQCASTKA